MEPGISWTKALDVLTVDHAKTAEALIAAADVREFEAGDTIIAQDDREDQVFIVLEGCARVVLLSESGQEIWLDLLEAGSILGEIAALTGTRRTSSIVADQPAVMASYSGDAFSAMIAEHGRFGLAVARILAQRVYHTTRRMYELSALKAPDRVCAELLRMSVASTRNSTRHIQPAPVLTEVAQRVNSTRETASRTVSKLEKRGLLKKSKAGYVLPYPDRLMRLLGKFDSEI